MGFPWPRPARALPELGLDPVAEGAAPHAALRPSVRDTLNRALWSRSVLSGSHDPTVLDPAPLARSAAVGLFAGGDLAVASSLGADVARVTHQAPYVVDTCRLFACMITAALEGRDRDVVLGVASQIHGIPLKEDVVRVAAEWLAPSAGRRQQPAAILGCLDKAARNFARAEDFESGLERLLASPGAYPDATFAAYGALAGAYWGEAAQPSDLHEAVAGIDRLEVLADRLYLRTRAAGGRVA